MSATGFSDEQKAAVLLRDPYCPLCGRPTDVVNHRLNRGSGGTVDRRDATRRNVDTLNRIDNACGLCWACNGHIESDPVLRADALHLGVKLTRPDFLTPLWSAFFGMWLILHPDDCFLTGFRDKTRRPDLLLEA
jgi:hypothetical protein